MTLKKKHVSICFHAVCEAVTSWIMCVGFVKGKNNLAGCKKTDVRNEEEEFVQAVYVLI